MSDRLKQWLGALVLFSLSMGTHAAEAVNNDEVRYKTNWIMGSYVTAVAYVGYTNWWKGSSGSFHFTDEGWLEDDSPRGGADKFGHMFTTYASTRLLTRALVGVGNPTKSAQTKAAWLAAGTSFGIEVLDGFSGRYGFSYEDMTFNLAGIGLGLFMERNPWWDERFDFRFHYRQSADSKRLNEDDVVSDYSGQSYLFMTKLGGYDSLKDNRLLRYLELGLGYGSRGYHPSDGTTPRERKLFFAVSLNLSQLLNDTVYRSGNYSRSKAVTSELFEYLQIPATTSLRGKSLDR